MSATGLTFFRGDRLLQARNALGMHQAELAKKVDINRLTISQWERGIRRPRADRIVGLAKALDVTVEWLAPLPRKPTLVQIRQQMGYTQTAWAEKMGLTGSQVASLENGRQFPPDVEHAASCWGLSVEEFWAAWERSGPKRPTGE